ncbi:MAG: EamA/RhaT family transporter, partial [Haemophilus parainfluenzae]|nr:EamA/RhaT family transporter [Haemophilus parainfluenzae]
MNPLRIHLQLIGMVILWGASWPWGRVVAQAMPTFVASSVRFFFAIIPLIIWLYA